jgi:ABC-type Fe3+-hydroxamate transport system substrate-binding protein
MVEHLGDLLDAQELAAELAADTRSAIAESIQSKIQNQKSKIFVPIWWNPLMGLGSATYGHDLLTVAGADNVLAGRDRYPALSLDEVRDLAPRLVLLPDEPFPFTDEHAAAFRPFAATRLIDGKLLWWYGPRMPAAIRTLHSLVAEARRRV